MFKARFYFFKKLFFRFLILFLLSLIPVIWVIQNDSKVQLLIRSKVIEILEKEWKSKIFVQSSDLNIFTGKINLKKGLVTSGLSKDFKWTFDYAKVRFSRMRYIFERKIVLNIKLKNIESETFFENKKLAITDHLKDIFSPSPEFDVDLQSVVIKNLKLHIFLKSNNEKNLKNFFLDLKGIFNFRKIINELDDNEKWRGRLSLLDGKLEYQGRELISNFKGRTFFYGLDSCFDKFYLSSNQEFDFWGKHCFLNTKIDGNLKQIFFDLDSDDSKIKVFPVGQNDLNITATIPFDIVKKGFNFFGKEELAKYNIDGTCFLNFNFNSEQVLEGNINIKTDFASIFGNCSIDCKTMQGHLAFKNSSNIFLDKFGLWNIKKNDFGLTLNFNKKLDFKGTYKVNLKEYLSNKKHSFKGNYFFKNNYLKLSGKKEGLRYLLEGFFDSDFYIQKILYLDKGEKLIDIFPDKTVTNKGNKFLSGNIKYSLIKDFLPIDLRQTIFGKSAVFDLKIEQKTGNVFLGSVNLNGGKLFILGNYNPIEDINFNFNLDIASNEILLSDLNINFFKGNIFVPKFIANFNKQADLNFVYLPIQIENLLINWKKDFFGLVYGNLLISKKFILDDVKNSLFKVSGDLVLKKSLLKGDFFKTKEESNVFYDYFLPDSIFLIIKLSNLILIY